MKSGERTLGLMILLRESRAIARLLFEGGSPSGVVGQAVASSGGSLVEWMMSVEGNAGGRIRMESNSLISQHTWLVGEEAEGICSVQNLERMSANLSLPHAPYSTCH